MSIGRRIRSAPLAVLATGAVLAGTAIPTMAATPPPSDADGIAAVVEAMSIDELIGQMTWTHVYGNSADATHASNMTRYGVNTPAEVVEKYHLGGVLYFAWSNSIITNNPTGAAELSNGLQAAAIGDDGPGIPLAITIDQEGGIVARMGAPVTVLPGNMPLGATYDEDLAYQQGEVLGAEMAAVGVNVDFAPVVDVNTNPANPVIGLRSLGEDPDNVAALGTAQILGMQSKGVAAAAKHFPGHGDTSVDSHTGLPIITYDRDVLDEHLKPFADAIDAGVDMIMTAHVIVEELDPDMPGTLSPAVLTGLLREEMGFEGLITTDALDMAALKQLPGNPLDDGEIAVLAIQAGSDILLNSPDLDAQFEGVRDAITEGELTREQLEESVTRILEWKLERGVWTDDPTVDVDAVGGIVGSDAHTAISTEIFEHAVTLVKNNNDVLPLDGTEKVLVVGVGSGWPERLGPELVDEGFFVTEDYEDGSVPSEGYRDRAVQSALDNDIVFFVSRHAHGNSASALAQKAMVEALIQSGTPVVVIAAGNPYDLQNFPGVDGFINNYGTSEQSFAAVTKVLVGDLNPSGRLPVNIPSADGSSILYPMGHGLSYGGEVEPTEVTPADVTFEDVSGTDDDSFTVPAVEGVEYLRDGDAIAAGTYDGEGTVTITAQALEGFVLAEGATTTWTHTFSTETDPVEPQPTVTVTVTAEPTMPEPGEVDVYSTPGFHQVNERWWHTECEPYSQTIRCRTEIWATQVTLDKGQLVTDTGWHFNNLTYLPFMTRAQWAGNPLGEAGEWTSADGREWKTECDTEATGRNGCRSWIWAEYVSSSQDANGAWSHEKDEGWVMNNIVRFRG